MEESWELLGVLGPASSQSDGNKVRGFEALEAKKVRTDFYLISFSIGKAYCLTEAGIALPVLTFEGLKGCVCLTTKAFAIPCCSRKLYF